MIDKEILYFSSDEKGLPSSAQNELPENWNLLVVDDDKSVHEVTQLVLRNVIILDRKISIHVAGSAQQAKELMLSGTTFAFALIDVVMETDTAGLLLIKWIREVRKDTNIRLVLRTGQPGEAPEKEIISRYDIHDYKEKSELTATKLFTLCYSCLRTYKDIIEAKKMQEMLRNNERMDAIGQLASGIVHDFNNILSIILGNVELLQYSPLQDERQKNKISAINNAALMGQNLVKKLHSFTTNKLEQKELVKINDLITNMDEVFDQSSVKKLQLDYQLGNHIWLTNIVQSDFESALFNLIINAKDAIKDDGKITIQTSNCVLDDTFCLLNPDATAGEYILLNVRDNGEGISKEDIQEIFKPFFTTKTIGSGLGLALVFGFVNRSLGYITLESELGKGTSFNIYLPKAV